MPSPTEHWKWPVFPGVELWVMKTGDCISVHYDVDYARGPATPIGHAEELARLRRRGLALIFGEA